MGAAENKRLITGVFDELSSGNGRPFTEMLADDVRWTVVGTSRWGRTYEGKRAVIDELMRPLFGQFADRYRAQATSITAEDDRVVVEARATATTKSGQPYNQTYCYVFRLANGKVAELSEYTDTELISRVLEPPD
jgi:ketosteroid isomerase-like protein